MNHILSVEISDLVTRACEISYGTKNPTVYKSIVFNNPEYSVEDGFIADRSAYAAALRDNLADAKIKCKDVVFVLTSSKVISREITIPELKDELIGELIENEREEYFPMDTKDHIFTFEVMEKLSASKQLRVLIFAAPDLLVKNYQVLAKEMDMNVLAIDYNGNTTYQFLKNSKQKMDIYVQVNEKTSLFTILEKDTLALQRNMNFGTHTLTGALGMSGYFGREIDDNTALVKLSENEMLYHSFVEMEEFRPEDSEEQKKHLAMETLTESVRPFLSNISRVLEYYNTKNRDAKVATIYLGGVGAKVKGLKELIESEFNGIEIVVADISTSTNFSKLNPVGIERSSEFIGCIGASVRTINFVKVDAKKKMENTLVFCFVALFLVILASIVIVLNGKTRYDNALAQKYSAEITEANLASQSNSTLQYEYDLAASTAKEIEQMDAMTYNVNEHWNEILTLLEQNAISDMELASLSSTESALTFNVILHSKEEVGQFLLQMQTIPYFKNITTGGISETKDEFGNISINLSVSCEYDVPAIEEEVEE